jgi:hypothetical protein
MIEAMARNVFTDVEHIEKMSRKGEKKIWKEITECNLYCVNIIIAIVLRV